MTRVFYVDAARAKSNPNYWKCSVVEKQENVANFYNGKAQHSIEAEAYAILKTVFWLVEQNYKGSVIIRSDYFVNKLWKRIVKGEMNQKRKLNRHREFLKIAHSVACANGIFLTVLGIPGRINPADYYSRTKHG